MIAMFDGWELVEFDIGEHTRTDQKTKPFRRLHRETASSAPYDVHGEVRVRPIPELVRAHIEGRAHDVAQIDVTVADAKFIAREAHGT